MGLQTAQPTFIFTMPEHSSGIIKGYTSFPVGCLSLYFDISCCGKHGLWLFWSIWVQSPHEGPSWGRAGEISLGGQTWFWRELRSVLEESWLHIKEPVYWICRFLGSRFLSDNNNKDNFRVFSLCLFFSVFDVFWSQRVQLVLPCRKGFFFLLLFSFLFCSSHWHIQSLVYNKDPTVFLQLTFLNLQTQWGLKEQIVQILKVSYKW